MELMRTEEKNRIHNSIGDGLNTSLSDTTDDTIEEDSLSPRNGVPRFAHNLHDTSSLNTSMESTISESSSPEKLLSKKILELKNSIIYHTRYLHRIRLSSLQSMKTVVSARRASIQAIRNRIEQVQLLYRIQLTKRYQLQRLQSKTTVSHFIENTHPHPSQLIIQPEHFHRLPSNSGLPSRRPNQPKNKQSSQKSLSKHESLITNLWEGSEYKIQLLSSLLKKLTLKFVIEIWKYLVYMKKLLNSGNAKIRELQSKFLSKLTYQSLLYNLYINQYIAIISEKRIQRFLHKEKPKKYFMLWWERSFPRKGKNSKYYSKLLFQSKKFHGRKLLSRYFPQLQQQVSIIKRKEILKQFSLDYSRKTISFLFFKKWQEEFMKRNLLKLEILQQYYDKSILSSEEINELRRKEGDPSSEGSLLEKKLSNYFQVSHLQKLIHFQHQLILKKYLQLIPSRIKEVDDEETEVETKTTEEKNILKSYLEDYNEKEYFEFIQEEMKKMIGKVMISKRLLPQQRFNGNARNGNFSYLETVSSEDYYEHKNHNNHNNTFLTGLQPPLSREFVRNFQLPLADNNHLLPSRSAASFRKPCSPLDRSRIRSQEDDLPRNNNNTESSFNQSYGRKQRNKSNISYSRNDHNEECDSNDNEAFHSFLEENPRIMSRSFLQQSRNSFLDRGNFIVFIFFLFFIMDFYFRTKSFFSLHE
jgi:hypothetical protein